MGHISRVFLEKLKHLLPAQDVARLVGALDPDGPGDAAAGRGPAMMRDTAFVALLERIAAEVPEGRSVAVRLGASMRCDDYGAFGLAFKSATDLMNSFERVARYGRVVTSVANFSVHRTRGGAFMAVREAGTGRLGEAMVTELALAAATALSREVSTRPLDPRAVHVSHAPPDQTRAFAAHFRCPVHFRSDRVGLDFSEPALTAGNRLGDAAVSEFLDDHLERVLADHPRDRALEPIVRAEIERALSDGVPTVDVLARQLGMSARTLQRRMAEEGIVYRDLAERTRLGLAERLLSETDYALAEVAFLTGYAEQSSFNRAFKRWNGQTPARWRTQVRTGAV